MSKRRIWRGNSASAPQGLRASFRIWARFDVRFGARFTAGGKGIGARGVWRRLPRFLSCEVLQTQAGRFAPPPGISRAETFSAPALRGVTNFGAQGEQGLQGEQARAFKAEKPAPPPLGRNSCALYKIARADTAACCAARWAQFPRGIAKGSRKSHACATASSGRRSCAA